MHSRRTFLSTLAAITIARPLSALAHPSLSTHFHLSYETLCDAIVHAKHLLASAEIGTSTVGGRQAVLAVWNPLHGKNDLRLVHVRDGVATTPGYTVKVVPMNGLPPGPDMDPYNGANTRYAVLEPEDSFVLAIKTNTKSVPGAIYVPYNPAYQTPEIVRAGREYIESIIRAAERRIFRNDVRSRINPSKLITEIIDGDSLSEHSLDADARVLLTLIADEHIDKDEYAVRGAGWTTDKVFVTLALNRESTYRFAVSSAGAGGLAQFIPSTYKDVRTRYPNAALPESFEEAMRDHEHSAVAQFCLIDRMLKALVESGQRIPRDKLLLGQYLAVSYNAGEHRGTPWLREHTNMCIKKKRRCRYRHGLPDETATYIKKYGLVHAYLYPRR